MNKQEFINKALVELHLVQEVMSRTGIKNLHHIDITNIKKGDYPDEIKHSYFVEVLNFLYDYVEEGILPKNYWGDEDVSVPIEDANEFLHLLMGSDPNYTDRRFVASVLGMAHIADRRFGIDFFCGHENGFEIEDLVLLAKVSERTVKNAISANELRTFKDFCEIRKSEITRVTAKSAIRWLANRRGFKPTVVPQLGEIRLLDVKTPIELKMYFKTQAERMIESHYLEGEKKEEIEQYAQTLSEKTIIEMSEVEGIAEKLRINRDDLLRKVFEMFFKEELDILRKPEVRFN
ncbi:MAG: hypothetical protein RBS36_11510 [Thiomicrospira sp.]|jgi:hypothetical protein|nr:hypothetical protein [Thiomicrospira sp.]